MKWTVFLWVLAFLWGAASVVCALVPGLDPDHAQLMGGLFLIGAIVSGKLDDLIVSRKASK